jgi:hypothetical protein
VVAAAVRVARHNAGLLGLAALTIALIGALAITGKPPGGQTLERFEANGIVAADPANILRVEIRLGRGKLALRRMPAGGWRFDVAGSEAASSELASHLEAALRFMHVSKPSRTLDSGDYRDAGLADFGLDPPAFVVSLGAVDRSVITADFGAATPAQTAQYVRLVGAPTLYLLPRHVGAEWQLTADLAQRSLPAASGRHAGSVLPVSIDRVWAVELVVGGKLHRFERDAAGAWFLHVGQHSHAGNAPGHAADPAKAPLIAAALAAFAESEVEPVAAQSADPARLGLERPVLIALVYPRDSSTPLARVEIGDVVADGFGRYARLSHRDGIVSIEIDALQRLVELPRAVGAAP